MGRRVVCRDCQALREHQARGLCRVCYAKNQKTRTLTDFPPIVNHDGGAGSPRGVTYRQLDYWVRRGYLKPDYATAGSGSARLWDEEERRVAETMARLVAAGLTPSAAVAVARGGNRCELAPGVFVEVA